MTSVPRAVVLAAITVLMASACSSATPTPSASGSVTPTGPSPTPGISGATNDPAASGVPPEPTGPGLTPIPPGPPTATPPTSEPTITPEATARPTSPPIQDVAIDVELVARGLDNPNGIFNAGDERLFISEQLGWVDLLVPQQDGSGSFERIGRFLDIQSRVACCGERGLLGLAFHPAYAQNGLFYVTYSDHSHSFVLEERRVSADDPNTADPDYRRNVIRVYKPFDYHWGGNIAFGPDGYLWLGMGDGGFGGGTNDPGDPTNLSQSLDTLFGKLLRIDPLDPDGDGPQGYSVPADNPYVERDDALPEIWARGLRNPWRWSFDRLTGDLWIADTGHETWEEVNRAKWPDLGKAWNYGWKLLEGPDCYDPPSGCDPEGRTMPPLAAYRHETTSGGYQCAVTGGFVYRGSDFPALQSRYLFGDYCSGTIYSVDAGGSDEQRPRVMLDTDFAISSMGQDMNGELFITNYSFGNETLYRIIAEPAG